MPASATTVGQPGLRNVYGEPLNLTGYNPTGSDFVATVTISATVGTTPARRASRRSDTPINQIRGGQQTDPAVATANNSKGTAANGDYVVVWTSDIGGVTTIAGQLYNAAGCRDRAGVHREYHASASWGESGRGHGFRGRLRRGLVGLRTELERSDRPVGHLHAAI